MGLINLLKKRNKKIEEIREELYQIQTDLIGAEVEHKGKEAIIMQVDWTAKEVLLNYDDENFEWISFE